MREAYTNYTLLNQNLHLYLSLINKIDNKCNVNKSRNPKLNQANPKIQ